MKHCDISDNLITLEAVAAQVASSELPAHALRNISSALRTIARVLDRPLAHVPAHANLLRDLLNNANPGAHGVGSRRWENVRSSLNRALRMSGVLVDGYTEPCTAEWENVAMLAGTVAECSAIRRLGRFCTAQQIAPADVCDNVIADYGTHLGKAQLSKTPKRIIGDVIRLWNRVADNNPRLPLPALTISTNDHTYTLRWTELPQGLAADANRFHTQSLKPDWFEDDGNRRPVRQTTADQRDRMLRRLASAEILAGVNADTLNSLADVIHPSRLRQGLDFMMMRADGKPNKQVFEMAHLALTIARHWAKLPADDIAQLDRWVKRVRPTKRGMTDKNRARLQQFNNQDVIARLVSLPEQVFAELVEQPATPARALRAQRALMLAILTTAPIRLANLRALDRLRHFQRAFSIGSNEWQLVLPAAEVKNDIDLAFPVPPHVMGMIDRYMNHYQPALARNGSTLLFPSSRQAVAKSDNGLRTALKNFVKRELGLTINPHLFRHLCAMIFLRTNPGQYESVRQLLGHKNIQTTIDHYASFENDEAMRRYTDIVVGMQQTGRKS